MSQQLAIALGGEPADDNLAVGSVVPVFVDATGRRRRLVIGLGWLVALCCAAYLAVIGISLTGTSVGPLPSLPNVTSKTVVFGSDVAGLPEGALEVPITAPAPQGAAEPATVRSFASSLGPGGASR